MDLEKVTLDKIKENAKKYPMKNLKESLLNILISVMVRSKPLS